MKSYFLCLFIALPVFASGHRELASIKHENREAHVRELLGREAQAHVQTKQSRNFYEKNLLRAVARRLPKAFKAQAQEIAETIIVESNRHQLDPFFVMAVIAGESSFNPLARGPVGEIGLMQLRPHTGKWIAKLSKKVWRGVNSLKNPITNIQLGTAYLGWLRSKFHNRGAHYIAAYNMGPTKLRSAISRKVTPRDYQRHVMKRYLALYKDLNAQKLRL